MKLRRMNRDRSAGRVELQQQQQTLEGLDGSNPIAPPRIKRHSSMGGRDASVDAHPTVTGRSNDPGKALIMMPMTDGSHFLHTVGRVYDK